MHKDGNCWFPFFGTSNGSMKNNFIGFAFTRNISLEQPVVKLLCSCLEISFKPFVFKIKTFVFKRKPFFDHADWPSNLNSVFFFFFQYFSDSMIRFMFFIFFEGLSASIFVFLFFFFDEFSASTMIVRLIWIIQENRSY